MSWFEKIMPSRIKTERRTRSVPEGLWIKCPACDAVLYRAELERNIYVCPKCSHHMRMGARDRLERFLDPETIEEIGATISPEDPLKFRDSKRYRDRLVQAQKATGESDQTPQGASTLGDGDKKPWGIWPYVLLLLLGVAIAESVVANRYLRPPSDGQARKEAA